MDVTNRATDDEVRAAVADPGRLAELEATGLLDSPPEEPFDRITRLAERLLDVPVALISLVDRDRQFFTSHVGLEGVWAEERQSPLSHSFCQYAVSTRERLVIDDTAVDPLVRANPAVSEQGIGSYAGQPLETSNGHVLGALCVIAHSPRTWREDELTVLGELSALAVTEIEYRLRTRSLREIENLTAALEEPVAHLGDAVRTMASVADRADDPLVGRMATLARTRLSSVEVAATDLATAVTWRGRKVDPVFVPIALGERLMRAVRVATATVPDRDVTVEVRDRPLTVACDPYALEQTLASMMVSVMQHSDGKRPVDVSAERAGRSVRLRVRGAGQAMPVAALARVVSQIDGATCDRADEGSGEASLRTIGRATTAESGPVEGTTGPGGTTLTVLLPLLDPAS
jgi:signal transduction histidine kinase